MADVGTTRYPLQVTGWFLVFLGFFVFITGLFSVVSAKLSTGLFSKGRDIYVELIVDGENQLSDLPKRTSVKKKTSNPQWEESFTVNVHESSLLEIRVVERTKLFDDNLFASKTVKISHWIKKESDNGKCKLSINGWLLIGGDFSRRYPNNCPGCREGKQQQ